MADVGGIPVLRIAKSIPQGRLKPALWILEESELIAHFCLEAGTSDISVDLKTLSETTHRPAE